MSDQDQDPMQGWQFDGGGRAFGPRWLEAEVGDAPLAWIENGRLITEGPPPPLSVVRELMEREARKQHGQRRRAMDPHKPQTESRENGILLCLDNGVRIECGGYPKPGAYLRVVDRDGYEIGYWNADEWQRTGEVMAEIMRTAAEGKEQLRLCDCHKFPFGMPLAHENPRCQLERNHQGPCQFEKKA